MCETIKCFLDRNHFMSMNNFQHCFNMLPTTKPFKLPLLNTRSLSGKAFLTKNFITKEARSESAHSFNYYN